ERLAAALRLPTGFALAVTADDRPTDSIVLELDRALEPKVGAEGYLLSVTPARVVIRAAADAGLFYGGVTLRQLLPPWVCSASKVTAVSVAVPDSIPGDTRRLPPQPVSWTAPCVEIEDAPRFAWRGLLLDVARHYMPPEFIRKLVDVMALHKLNVLQLHLTDDQGWRLEIRKYPRLTEVGSVRKESPKHGDRNRGDGTPYGPFFYTQEQMRGLVAYAQARHVTLVPEIEMPGHVLGALMAYPELSCRGGPFQVRTRWGVEPDILCAGNDKAIAFAQDVLGEVIALFPCRFIHIGGDEAPRDRWKACPKCQARLKAAGLKNEAQLQTWFNQRIEEFLTGKGRRMIGWDEILEGGLTPGAAVMSWRGMDGGITAAKAGHDVVMAPTSHCYFDYAQAHGPGEPECIGGYLPLRTVYAFEPVPAALPETDRRHILGPQATLWSEYLWTPQDVEYFAFPRASALAEVAWSPVKGRDFSEFRGRLEALVKRLELLGVQCRRLDPRPLGEWSPESLTTRGKFARDLAVPPDQIAQPGRYEVQVVYHAGAHGMYFDGVELLCEGQVVAKDPHRGFTGAKQDKPVFTLSLPQVEAGKRYAVRLNFDSSEGTDSRGEVQWRRVGP
ncbi:MAG: beta-N-acetylhexosaminidase, partial [Planctomycetota bacterium]|nr:beta-N-acetylhexosaminidase [Planctomycetota bacterium]